MRGSVGIVAKPVNENLDMLAILLLGLVFTLLVEQPLLLALDEGLKVSPVTVQPLAVQVDDVCGYGIQEVAVMGDDQDCAEGEWSPARPPQSPPNPDPPGRPRLSWSPCASAA